MQNCIDFEALEAGLNRARKQYEAADPYPWCEFENFLLPGKCDEIAAGFDEVLLKRAARDPQARRHLDVNRKIATNDLNIMTPAQRRFFEEATSPRFLNALRTVTGVKDLTADPEFAGSGLHQIYPGGFLNLHADFNFHPTTGLQRKLNLILYLNSDWQDEWLGHLELWPEEFDREPVRIAPTINRAVMFETSETSWHGHPQPLACPDGTTRKSLALYYYSNWPDDLERRARTKYVLEPSQRAELEARLAQIIDEVESEREACKRIPEFGATHVQIAYRKLKAGRAG